jgi:hypothetical protein
MKVTEIINEALFTIRYKEDGFQDPGSHQFSRNLRRFQMVADSVRTDYPFNTTSTIDFNDLSSLQFVDIESVVATEDPSNSNINYPLIPVDLFRFNELNRYPKVGGIPEFYYWEKSGVIKVYPQEVSQYKFLITGKLNNSLDITAETELDPSPMMFQNYLTLLLAKRLASVFNKPWTQSHKEMLSEAHRSVEKNRDSDHHIYSPDSDQMLRIFRPRNLVNG